MSEVCVRYGEVYVTMVRFDGTCLDCILRGASSPGRAVWGTVCRRLGGELGPTSPREVARSD